MNALSPARPLYHHLGLFLTTLALLMQELLDSRLLSVVTAYHLSFLAISTAMLGGAAGAIFVFVRGQALMAARARTALPRWGVAFALVMAGSQLAMLRARVENKGSLDLSVCLELALVTVLLTLPFFIGGVTVTIALTRVGGRIGTLYAADLLGAALGCVVVVPVLNHSDMGTGMLLAASLAAAGAVCFARALSQPVRVPVTLALSLVALSLFSLVHGSPVELAYVRGRRLNRATIDREVWNAHSHVVIHRAMEMPAFVWGRGRQPKTDSVVMFIDGDAATPITRWDGRRESLAWLATDVTALAHRLNPGGDAAIMGVGGGRDILSALYGQARSVTAVEINRTFIDALSHSHRDFAKLADHPGVRLVHDEARAFMARHDGQFDVLEMSLVDTWAATAAGAFTLTENALYTREAWVLFLSRLKPGGIFSTSRWFAPKRVSETNRLVGLAVSALLELGVDNPAQHIAMAASGPVASLLVSRTPFTRSTINAFLAACREQGFRVIVAPGVPVTRETEHLARIANARNEAMLVQALADPHFDYAPPTDERPYFFNMLRPSALWPLLFPSKGELVPRTAGVMWGNIRATGTLSVLACIATLLVVLLVVTPLACSGLPDLSATTFSAALCYFGVLGAGFMLVQVGLLQRFSVYLGHPIYSYVVILFAMILAAGIGSYLSERVTLAARGVPLLGPSIGAYALALAFLLPPLFASTSQLSLVLRCTVVVAIVAPLACLMGFCFPLGARMLERLSADAMPWMWGVNGALGVLASIAAVAISMFIGISENFLLAAGLYACLWPLSRYLLNAGHVRSAAAQRAGKRR